MRKDFNSMRIRVLPLYSNNRIFPHLQKREKEKKEAAENSKIQKPFNIRVILLYIFDHRIAIIFCYFEFRRNVCIILLS